jgi:hypothetical protein
MLFKKPLELTLGNATQRCHFRRVEISLFGDLLPFFDRQQRATYDRSVGHSFFESPKNEGPVIQPVPMGFDDSHAKHSFSGFC